MVYRRILRKDEWEDLVLITMYWIDGDLNDYTIRRNLKENLRGGYNAAGDPLTNDEINVVVEQAIREANRRWGFSY